SHRHLYCKAQKDPAVVRGRQSISSRVVLKVELPGLTDSEFRKVQRRQKEDCRVVQPWRGGCRCKCCRTWIPRQPLETNYKYLFSAMACENVTLPARSLHFTRCDELLDCAHLKHQFAGDRQLSSAKTPFGGFQRNVTLLHCDHPVRPVSVFLFECR